MQSIMETKEEDENGVVVESQIATGCTRQGH